MSVWSTKSSGRARTYVVIQHKLKAFNQFINGVRFRNGYAVVEKDSKTYSALKKLPLIKNAREFPLSFLKELPFITRTSDIKLVFGVEVYEHFIKEYAVKVEEDKVQQAEKIAEQEAVAHVQEHKKCAHISENTKELCEHTAYELSPGGHCYKHLLEDPKLAELGIEVPRFLTKKEKAALKEKIANQLQKMKK